MKTLSTLFIAAAFAFSMIACGGSEADAAESQSDDTEMTTGDEMGADEYGTEDEALMGDEETEEIGEPTDEEPLAEEEAAPEE